MENKSLGGALVDVFDAGVSLVKSEINAVTRRVGTIAKAKGLGVVLLLAALVPLTLALIFLILFLYYGLIRLGLAPWSAALIMGVVSLVVAAGLIFVALKKLGSDVPDDSEPPLPLSDIAKDDQLYGQPKTGPVNSAPGAAGITAKVATGTGMAASAAGTPVFGTVGPANDGSTSDGQAADAVPRAPTQTAAQPSEPAHTTGGHAVYEAPLRSPPDGRGDLQSTSTQGKPSSESESVGIPVSTDPTYQDDMKKEGY